MLTNMIKAQTLRSILWVDILLLLVVIYLIPVLSHMTALPLYLAEPMRISLFLSYLLTRNTSNAYILGISIPLFSFLISGHPVPIKATIIAIELLSNMFLFLYLTNKLRCHYFPAFMIAILFSKFLYYAIKALFIHLSWLNDSLVATPIIGQLIASTLFAIIFSWLYKQFLKVT